MNDLTPGKRRVLDRIDQIANEGDGYGTLRVEIRAGKICLIKREYSEEIKSVDKKTIS